MIKVMKELPARMDVTLAELKRLKGNFYVKIPFMDEYWVRINKQDLFRTLNDEVITNVKYDIYDTGEKVYVHGFTW